MKNKKAIFLLLMISSSSFADAQNPLIQQQFSPLIQNQNDFTPAQNSPIPETPKLEKEAEPSDALKVENDIGQNKFGAVQSEENAKENAEYYIVDGSIDLIKELAELSNTTTDQHIAYESARFANYISQSVIKARMEGQKKIIIVNIPSYTLYAINLETGKVDIESKVIVGSKVKSSKTPIFSTNIKSITFNPTWTPPVSVLRRSVYPTLGKKGGYADKHGLVVEKNGYLIPLGSSGVTLNDIKGSRIYQPPGKSNSLGRLRFNADNNMNIYLHDTNQRYLFDKDDRAFSLGCVRVQQWDNLAIWIGNWTKDWLSKNVENKSTNGDYLTKTYTVDKISVSIGYFKIKQNKDKIWENASNVYNIED